LFVAILCALALLASFLFSYTPPLLALLIFIMSLLGFVYYAKDKRAAQKQQWRVPENFLHMLALLGGWPGAWIAQERLRHKTRKTSFRVVFWLTVLINGGALAWLHTPQGHLLLRDIMSRLDAHLVAHIPHRETRQVGRMLIYFYGDLPE
jgi:uncharacterized membrane protein YsdA (DUF1294 family)